MARALVPYWAHGPGPSTVLVPGPWPWPIGPMGPLAHGPWPVSTCERGHPVTKKYIAIGSKAHGPTIALYYLLLECTEKHLHALEKEPMFLG